MKTLQKHFCLAVVMSMGLFYNSAKEAIAAPRIKLIEAGWERPNADDLLKYQKIIEKTPYDGIVLMLNGKDDAGKTVSLQNGVFDPRPLKLSWFAKQIKELKSFHSTKLTDNFVRVSTSRHTPDWFDDAAWKHVIANWEIAATIAKEGHLKGICFDPEMYSDASLFTYHAQKYATKYSFDEYSAKVRQRGQQIIQAVSSIDPGMVFFTFRMNDINKNHVNRLQTTSYGLYPALINGWLDVAPPQMTFVDGVESAYRSNGELDYLRAANAVRNTVLSLVVSEDRAKYKAQVQVAFAFYLDAYVNPESSSYYIPPTDGSRVTTFANNLGFASEASDGYIWTWGEKYRWWPTKTKRVNPEYWEEKLPGITEVLRNATDPDYWKQQAQAKLDVMEKTGKLVNLVTNGDFAGDASTSKNTNTGADWKSKGAPPGWSTWQKTIDGKDLGTFKWDAAIDHTGKPGSGSARISNIQSSGTYIQSIPVKTGEQYALRAWQRFAQDGGHGNVTARWQDANGNWVRVSKDVAIFNSEKGTAGEWHQLSGFIKVPQDAAKMILLLGASTQSSPEDGVWYDDVELYKIQ